MISGMFRAACAVVALTAANSAYAQDGSSCPASNNDWTVCENPSPHECWAVSAPKETVNTRDGNVVAARRGDILLYVSYRPENGVKDQVAFAGGYPFAENSTVELDIGGTKFELYVDGEYAWPANAEVDAQIVDAMRRGSSATATGRSSRGTVTKDTFSLLGFTASVEEAAKRCGG